MLIIFDLDDTLINTSEVITPWRFKQVISVLNISDELKTSLLGELLDNHMKFSSSSEALSCAMSKFQCDEQLILAAQHQLSRFEEHIPVELFAGVVQLLNELKKHHTLFLVTKGMVNQQTAKITKAGLSKEFFEDIFIVESGSKKEFFKKASFAHPAQEVLVVGDRVKADLEPAKQLGFLTCLVRQGRGRFQEICSQTVDYVIQDVAELENLIKSIHKTLVI